MNLSVCSCDYLRATLIVLKNHIFWGTPDEVRSDFPMVDGVGDTHTHYGLIVLMILQRLPAASE